MGALWITVVQVIGVFVALDASTGELSSVVAASFARAKQQVGGGWGGVEACIRKIVCNSGRVYPAYESGIGMYLRRPNNQQRGLVFCSRRCCHAGRTGRMRDSVYVLDTFYRGLF